MSPNGKDSIKHIYTYNVCSKWLGKGHCTLQLYFKQVTKRSQVRVEIKIVLEEVSNCRQVCDIYRIIFNKAAAAFTKGVRSRERKKCLVIAGILGRESPMHTMLQRK